MSSSSPSSPSTARSGALKMLAMLTLSLSLGACDYVSNFTKPKQTPEEAKAEGIALGAGCRQAGQSLEDCYQRNPNAQKAGIFTGWKDMHEYMAAKGIETVAPPPPPVDPNADAAKDKDKDADPDAGKDERTLRRERRERERAEREKSADSSDSKSSKSSDSKSSKSKDSDSSRKSRDNSSSKNY